MAEFLAEHDGIYGKRLVRRQIVFPTDGLHLVVHLVGVVGGEVLQRLQDADGGAQAEVGFVKHCFVTRKRYHSPAYLYVIGTQFRQFLCQYFFQTLEGLGYHLKRRLFAHFYLFQISEFRF